MPKQIQKFGRFEGGINEGSDPRDVAENELVKSDNITVDDLGTLKMIGSSTSNDSTVDTLSSTTMTPGYGLFSYSTDYDHLGVLNPTDWVAILNGDDGNLELRHTSLQSGSRTTGTINDAIDLGDNNSASVNNEASFYFGDGALRLAQGNLSHTKDTKWYGYIKENFFQTTDGSNSSGTPVSEISAWTQTIASPKSPSQLGVNLDIHDASTANPSSSTVGATAGDKLILSYMKTTNGGWNGVFSFGATFVYKGGAESAMTKFTETIPANEEKISFQLYIPIGTSASPSADAGNGLGDNRIVGVNFYFKEFEQKEYRLLTNYDLLIGGDNHWKAVNTDTTSDYGVFDGSISIPSDCAAKTTEGSLDHWSYASTTITVTIVNNASGFSGRSGYVRVYGGFVSPLYKTATTNLASGGVVVPMKNGAEGTNTMKVELLDESFNVLAESDEQTYTVQDSGRTPPDDYDDDDLYAEQADWDPGDDI